MEKFIIPPKIPLQELAKENLHDLPPQETLDKYRWETRIVTRDGMVSFDGVRYGVPWQYSGKEVRVSLCAGYLEICYGEILLAKHKVQIVRVIGRAYCFVQRCPFDTKLFKIETIYKRVDDTHWVVFSYVVLNAVWQQCHLFPTLPFYVFHTPSPTTFRTVWPK